MTSTSTSPSTTSVGTADVVLRSVRTDIGLCDVEITSGQISAIVDVGIGAGLTVIEGAERLCLPAFVEPHFHLDKCFETTGSAPGRSLESILDLYAQQKADWTDESVALRAERGARLLASLGVGTVRTFADIDPYCGLTSARALRLVADRLRPIIDIQVIGFVQHGLVSAKGVGSDLREAIAEGLIDGIGGHPQLEQDERAGIRQLTELGALALEHELPIDLHVDETDDPASRWLDRALEVLDDPAFDGRLTMAHACTLAARPDDEWASITETLHRRRINVVSSPTSGLLFRGIGERRAHRGIVPVRQLLEVGVNVAIGQEVYRSLFSPSLRYPDPLLSAQVMGYVAQLADDWGLDQLGRMLTHNAATTVGLHPTGVTIEAPANLVLVDAHDLPDAITRVPPRQVIHFGSTINHPPEEATR